MLYLFYNIIIIIITIIISMYYSLSVFLSTRFLVRVEGDGDQLAHLAHLAHLPRRA